MGMRDDIDAMERHSENGTLKEWFDGTAEPIPIDTRLPIDRSASRNKAPLYTLIVLRGD